MNTISDYNQNFFNMVQIAPNYLLSARMSMYSNDLNYSFIGNIFMARLMAIVDIHVNKDIFMHICI